MNAITTLGKALVAAALLAAGPSTLNAQVNFDARGGAALPAGDLADLTDVGGTAGLGVGYRVHSRVNFRLDGDVDILSASDDALGAPDLRLWHYGAGAEISVIDPARSRVTLDTNVGAGATTIDTDEFGRNSDLTETYFSLNGGLKLGYDVSRNVNVFVGGQAYLTFADEADLRPLAAFSRELAGKEVDALWSLPIHAGIRINLGNGRQRVAAGR